MLYTVTLKLEAFHKPTETWHVYEAPQGLKAVSRTHALDKGLKILQQWPGYADRINEPEWVVTGSASLAA
jgi:hypothetical protein